MKDISLENKNGSKRIAKIIKGYHKGQIDLTINSNGSLITTLNYVDTINIIGEYYLNLIENFYTRASIRDKSKILEEYYKISTDLVNIVENDRLV